MKSAQQEGSRLDLSEDFLPVRPEGLGSYFSHSLYPVAICYRLNCVPTGACECDLM